MNRKAEIKEKAIELSNKALAAVRDKDLPRVLKIHNELDPLLRELAMLTGDNSWIEMADEGVRIHKNAAESLGQ